MKKLFLTAALFLSALLLFGCSPKTYKVELPGNPTTGFAWTYVMEPEGVVEETSSKYTENKSFGEVGVGGTYEFTFKSVAPGTVALNFVYSRDWDETEPPAETATYVLTVDEKGKIHEDSAQLSFDVENVAS